MDTPALTPETLVVSSLEPAHQPIHSSKPSPSFHTTMEHSTFFTQSVAPLSPPESPFNFGAAFKPAQITTVPAPASPHFELPARCKRKIESPTQKPQPSIRARSVARKAQNNPYFPSVEEQERRERWNKDAARLPQPSPPLAPQEHTPPTDDDEALPALQADANTPVPDMDWSLSPVERKRALKIRLPERKAEEFSASNPEALPPSSRTSSPLSAEEYRKAMASHLQGALRLREEEQTRRKKEENPFRW